MQWIRQRMIPPAYGAVNLPEQHELENGNVEVKLVNQANFDLPDKSTTNLQDLINAGVDLRRVDPAVYGYGSGGDIVTGDPQQQQQQQINNEGDKK